MAIGRSDVHDKKEGLHDPSRKLEGITVSKDEENEQEQ
jgi:hypothetical protein